MRKGSITIFALLSMMLVASSLLAMLEASRFHQIKKLAEVQTEIALESVFAEYNTQLWEEYRILACSKEMVKEKLESYGNRQMIKEREGINFFQFQVRRVDIEGYTRLTDKEGSAFIQAAAGYMEKNVLYEMAKNIYSQYEGVKNIQNQSGYSFKDISKALNELNSVEEESRERIQSRSREGQSEGGKNILEDVQKIQKKGILSLVLEEESSISEKEFETTDRVSQRILPDAYNPKVEELDWHTKVLFQQYILTYLSSYMDEEGHALDYEVEYLLVGKDTDVENLKGTIKQLMAIRAATNFLYLSSSVERQEQASALAIGIAGASANPILIEVVKAAIVTGWAFGESVLDIRTLLTGGKISLLKSDTTWTLNLDMITQIEEGFPKAKNCEDGLSYKDYLGILLLLQKDEVTAMRAMDVQEQMLREKYEDTSICMEDLVTEIRATIEYRYRPVFFSIRKVVPLWNYEIIITEGFSY